LLESIEQQLELRSSGEKLIQISRAEILEQIKATLAQALKLGSKAGDIQSAVDDLVRPLSHRLALDLHELSRNPKQPKRSIKIYPVLQTAFSKTAFNPLPVALMAVFGTITSRLWTFGPQALIISLSDLVIIWAGMLIAKRLKISRFLAIFAWILIGFSSAAVADLIVNPDPLSNPTALLYFSVNVLGPALLFALLAAYDLEAEKNLGLLKLSLSRLEWETQAMRQRLWLERKRLSRFVHSELQSRLRSFAMRFQFQGSDPSEADLKRLREECEAALVFDDEQKPLSEQLKQTIELWRGVLECEVLISDELMDLVEQDPYASSAVAEVIREGITNAVRHGGANHVRVDCTITGDTQTGHALKLAITDNGQQDLVDNSGLGMKMLGEVTSSYSLSRDSGLTILSAELPIRLSTQFSAH
jgi:signal transduction histidine kinase